MSLRYVILSYGYYCQIPLTFYSKTGASFPEANANEWLRLPEDVIYEQYVLHKLLLAIDWMMIVVVDQWMLSQRNAISKKFKFTNNKDKFQQTISTTFQFIECNSMMPNIFSFFLVLLNE